MLPSAIDSSLVIAASMLLMPCGHPDALLEVQRQMRLINRAYPDPGVLRATDDVVRHATRLHGPPVTEPESERREGARAAVGRLRALLESLPLTARLAPKTRARAR